MIDMVTVSPRPRSGIKGESTSDEAYGVLSGEERLVRDIMTRKIVTVQSSMTREKASETIRNQKTSILVIYRDDEPVHALTELDLAGEKIPREDISNVDTLQEIFKHRAAVRCREDAILADALHAMTKHRIGHVPVLDATGGLVGALSLVDAVGAVSPAAAERWLAKMKGWSMTPPPSK
ncbi:MAG: CBS domain-containing protein [Nitrospira sp.]|nr:CBS domain-containing protein [Nitrospira sp.]